MSDSVTTLTALQERLTESWQGDRHFQHECFGSGHASLDVYLKGGFQRGQLHEILADDTEDNGSACGFAAMLATRGLQSGKSMLWLRTHGAMHKGGRFHPCGFAELGGDPARLFMAVARDEKDLLRCAVDALRCDSFSVAVIECWGSPAILDLTAFRRLTLAANQSGVTALMLRLDAHQQPSTASTRWSVRSAPSTALEADAPGYPVCDLTLLRQRAGPSGKSWRVEWDRDAQTFREPSPARQGAVKKPALSGAVVSFPTIGQAAARERLKFIA